MQEVWKDIKGYEGLYQVSNKGRIRSLKFINNRSIKKRIKILSLNYGVRTNRYYVDLHKNAIREHKTVHRLVAEAFIPNPNNYPVINHIDGNSCNNEINNLEWCTLSHNSKHAYTMGLTPKFVEMNSKAKKRVVRDDGKKYSCAYECARDLGASVSSVRDTLKRRTQTCKGYKLYYEV